MNTVHSLKKNFYPYLVKTNLALPEQSCLSAWTLYLEFLKLFCASQATANKDRRPRAF
jgi:hypothetical protein